MQRIFLVGCIPYGDSAHSGCKDKHLLDHHIYASTTDRMCTPLDEAYGSPSEQGVCHWALQWAPRPSSLFAVRQGSFVSRGTQCLATDAMPALKEKLPWRTVTSTAVVENSAARDIARYQRRHAGGGSDRPKHETTSQPALALWT